MVIEENQSDSEALVFPFHLTQFIAVTAYQSAKLTELKKEKNPFARGVRQHESETDAYIDTSSTFYPPGKFSVFFCLVLHTPLFTNVAPSSLCRSAKLCHPLPSLDL